MAKMSRSRLALTAFSDGPAKQKRQVGPARSAKGLPGLKTRGFSDGPPKAIKSPKAFKGRK